jgi:hypothetical protein
MKGMWQITPTCWLNPRWIIRVIDSPETQYIDVYFMAGTLAASEQAMSFVGQDRVHLLRLLSQTGVSLREGDPGV